MHATTKGSPSPANPLHVSGHDDDAVTSVVDTAARGTSGPPSGVDEDQITHTAVRSEAVNMASHTFDNINSAANDDQTDRVRIMARGSRDAILRARERAAQRRQVARPMIEPAAAGDEPDEDAHPERHDRVESTYPAESGSTVGRMAAYERTPPVPREEVDTRGGMASPMVGTDDRFDSVPPIKADIELPRLRQFLSHERSEPRRGRNSAASSQASSYEHVLKRAREIKASAPPDSPETHRTAFESLAPRESHPAATDSVAPDPSGRESGHEPDVIWDLDVASLDVAFTRVRSVLDDAEQQQRSSPRQQRGIQAPPSQPDVMAAAWEDALYPDPVHFDEPPVALDEAIASGPSYRVVESPRSSWWRSLNFGMRRRVNLERHNQPYRDAVFEDDPVDLHGDVAAQGQQYSNVFVDDGYTVDDWNHEEYQDVDSGWDDTEIVAESDPGWGQEDDLLITSDVSWQVDLESFPQAQPPTWHEQRAALLANSPFGTMNDPLPPVPTVPKASPATVKPPSEAAPAPAPRERRTYSVDQPGGMSAFREALFGASPPLELVMEPPISQDQGGVLQEPGDWSAPSSQWSDQPVPEPRPRPNRRATLRTPQQELPEAPAGREDEQRQFQVASTVRRCCLTCRSFQPTGDSGQGRCSNAVSHTYKQLVHADSLPCHSSIGDWWLADDMAWIPPETMIRPATPHTDRMQMEQGTRNQPSERDGRRVRTRRAV
ncbi:MAG TPA: hypothetical protein VD767_06835 [Thermomicrobiales bacterium]|nr:hypothetical protein [Thermomicrobiales bacterium]